MCLCVCKCVCVCVCVCVCLNVSWLSNQLSGRTQAVKINNIVSIAVPVPSDVIMVALLEVYYLSFLSMTYQLMFGLH